MADYNLGTARGRIRTEYDNTGVKQAEKSFTGLEKSTKGLKGGFEDVRNVSGAASLTIAAGLAFAAKTAIDFEKQISQIGAVSDASSQQMESLRKKALQLGADTSFSASEAASAMEELAKAGVGVDDILNGAADAAVALAAAGGVDLPTAAEIAANSMSVFNLKASAMAEVVDLIAGAANQSSISVEDFNESMKQAGAVSHLVGLSFEDMAVAITLMGKAGIKGSDAGTSLKTMLSNLQPTTAKQTELMRELGIVTKDGANQFFDAHGKIKSLADISGILSDAMKNMTAQQKQLTLETLFGSDAIRAAAILSQAGAKGFNDLAKSMEGVRASDVAAKRLDNVAGSIEQLKGSMETAAISIGSALLPAIRAVTTFITTLVNKFNALDPRWQKLIAFALVAATVLLGLVSAVAAIGAAIAGISAAAGALAAGGVVAAVVAAIGLIIAAITLLWKRSEAFRQAVATVFGVISKHANEMKKTMAPLVNFVRNELIPILQNGLKKAIENMRPAFEAVSQFMTTKVAPALAKVREALNEAMPTIVKVARFVGQALANSWAVLGKILGVVVPILLKVAGFIFPLLAEVIAFLIRNIPTFVATLQMTFKILGTIGKVIAALVILPLLAAWKVITFVFNGIKTGISAVVSFWKAMWAFFGPPVVAAFNLIKGIVSLAITVITTILTVFWTIVTAIWKKGTDILTSVVSNVFGFIKGIITNVMDFLMPYIQGAWQVISNAISTVLNVVGPLISKVWTAAKTATTTVWNAVTSFLSTAWNAIKSTVAKGVEFVTNTIDKIKAIVDKVKNFFGQLKTAASGGVGSLIDFVKQIPGKIISAIGNVGSLLYNKGKEIIQGLIDGIKAMFGKLRSIVSDAMDIVGRFLPGSPAKEGPLSGQGYVKIRGQHLTEDFAAGIEQNTRDVKAAVAALVGSLAATLPNPQNAALVAAGTATAAGVATVARRTVPAPAQSSGDVIINNLNLNGTWDFSDPMAGRKIVAQLDAALTDYKKGYR